MPDTSAQYDSSIKKCRDIFVKKMSDYGSSWRILRASSITDQIFIKGQRIRTIESLNEQKVEEGVEPEYIGIINYSVMGLIQLELGNEENLDMEVNKAEVLYDKFTTMAKNLMGDKNHDYGEAWRELRISSITDLILQKILRIKQIEDNKGETIISEGIDAGYLDMINYAVFALIRLEEGSS